MIQRVIKETVYSGYFEPGIQVDKWEPFQGFGEQHPVEVRNFRVEIDEESTVHVSVMGVRVWKNGNLATTGESVYNDALKAKLLAELGL